ncbi:MAG TPA: CYTH domain-containing protein [Symbiobacteriaceae bacterium]
MEVEIKLNVKPAIEGGPVMLFTKLTMQPSLAGYPMGPISKYEIHDLYFDTPDGALAKAGAGLRCRVVNGGAWVTLKVNHYQNGALTSREEFEEPLYQDRLDWVLSHIRQYVGDGPFPAEDFAAGRPCGGLIPVLRVGTARLSRPVGDVAELSLDMVEYPGVSTHPYFDIEVEAKAGPMGELAVRQIEEALYQLAGGYLAPARESKLERGLRLKAKVRRQA